MVLDRRVVVGGINWLGRLVIYTSWSLICLEGLYWLLDLLYWLLYWLLVWLERPHWLQRLGWPTDFDPCIRLRRIIGQKFKDIIIDNNFAEIDIFPAEWAFSGSFEPAHTLTTYCMMHGADDNWLFFPTIVFGEANIAFIDIGIEFLDEAVSVGHIRYVMNIITVIIRFIFISFVLFYHLKDLSQGTTQNFIWSKQVPTLPAKPAIWPQLTSISYLYPVACPNRGENSPLARKNWMPWTYWVGTAQTIIDWTPFFGSGQLNSVPPRPPYSYEVINSPKSPSSKSNEIRSIQSPERPLSPLNEQLSLYISNSVPPLPPNDAVHVPL